MNLQKLDKINYKLFFKVLFERKTLFLLILVGGLVLAMGAMIVLPEKFKSTTILEPVKKNNTNNLSAIAGNFQGLASLAGIDIGNESTDINMAIAIIKSKHFFRLLLENNKLSVNFINTLSKQSFKKNYAELSEEDIHLMHESFKESIVIIENRNNGLYYFSYTSTIPSFSRDVLLAIYSKINQEMTTRKETAIKKNIQFINDRLDMETVTNTREVLFQLLQEQLKEKMFLESSSEAVFKMVVLPDVSLFKYSPNLTYILIVCILLSLMLIVIIVLTLLIKEN